MKKRKKNPYVVDYGYHLTNKDRVSSILEKGLIPKYKGHNTSYADVYDIQKDLYRNIRPIYFLDIPDVKKLTKQMKVYIHEAGYDTMLKIDVRDYNQVPDYNSLLLDYRFIYRKYQGENEPGLRIFKDYVKDNKFKKILSSYYERDKYEFIIPLSELKNNEELQAELIYFTETFCVDEIISPDKIKEILPL